MALKWLNEEKRGKEVMQGHKGIKTERSSSTKGRKQKEWKNKHGMRIIIQNKWYGVTSKR